MYGLKDKAQISMFVIIGFILVLVLAYLFFSSNLSIFQDPETRLKNQFSDIVEDCVKEHARTGTFLLGYQGGHLYIPDSVRLDPRKHISFGDENVSSLSLMIPNWDPERSDIPTISSMEGELQTYVEEEAAYCIKDGLRALEENYDIEAGDLEIAAEINRENVILNIHYPIEFNEKNSVDKASVSEFYVQLDGIRLGALYELASDIYQLEGATYFLEEKVLDQIYSAGDYSSPISMPSEGFHLSCGTRIWTKEQLKENLANLNNANFKYLTLLGTRDKSDIMDANLREEYGLDDARAYYENNYVYSLTDVPDYFKNFDVNIFMPSAEVTGKESFLTRYPFRTFEVTPSSGQTVKAMELKVDTAGGKIPIPCIQVFHHLYDLDYDLMIQLRDMSEDGEGYIFQFPVRVVIDHNTPRERPVTATVREPRTANNEAFCSDESKEYPMLVYAKDDNSNYLSGVNITYKCVDLSCAMGSTSAQTIDFNENTKIEVTDPSLEAKFPFCIGGQLVAEKEGYHTAKAVVRTDDSLLNRNSYIGDNLVELELIPLKEFTIDKSSFLVMMPDGTSKRIISEDDGSVFVSLTNEGHDFSSEAVWPNDGTYLNTLEFLDSSTEDIDYNLSIVVQDSNYQLIGMLELQNWTPEIHSANGVIFIIPGVDGGVTEDNYVEYYAYMKEKAQTRDYQVRFT
ncbi:MAG: hypothetical protein H6500_01370 [Candidatus Woesearchaeota archaeon]|nr:MAG: hypothetical protein H6500_01370 [Candidatus Woesearchaeota archaeon]